MKRIIAIILSLVFVLALFAACGKKDEIKDDVKDEITTLRNELTSALDKVEEDMTDIGDKLTDIGNVTDQTGEGALEEAITDISEMLEGDKKDTTVKAETETTKKR